MESSVSLTARTSGVSQTLSITGSVASSVVTTQRHLLISTLAISRSVVSEISDHIPQFTPQPSIIPNNQTVSTIVSKSL